MKKDGKLLAAVELGRLGGLKGGKARAQKLSAKRRSEIARVAAETRWAKQENTPALVLQIREGFEAYKRGDYRSIDEFMAELESEVKKSVRSKKSRKP